MKKLLFATCLTALFLSACNSPETDAKKTAKNMQEFTEAANKATEDGKLDDDEIDNLACVYSNIVETAQKYQKDSVKLKDYQKALKNEVSTELNEQFFSAIMGIAFVDGADKLSDKFNEMEKED